MSVIDGSTRPMWWVVKVRNYNVEYRLETLVDGVRYTLDASFDNEYEAKALCKRLNREEDE